jgi:hypothetical protein
MRNGDKATRQLAPRSIPRRARAEMSISDIACIARTVALWSFARSRTQATHAIEHNRSGSARKTQIVDFVVDTSHGLDPKGAAPKLRDHRC